jgi:hypothetical protein
MPDLIITITPEQQAGLDWFAKRTSLLRATEGKPPVDALTLITADITNRLNAYVGMLNNERKLARADAFLKADPAVQAQVDALLVTADPA